MKSYIILLILLPALIFAQPGLLLKTSSGYTDNAFNNYRQNSDYYTWLNAYANHDWIQENSGIRFYYDGSYSAYNQYSDKNYMVNDFGMSFYNYLGQKGNRINAGLSFGSRNHSDAYSWYNVKSGNLYANIKLVLTPQFYGYAGIEMDMQQYDVLEPFSNTQSRFYLRVSRFFNSGTTLIAETDLMSKYYSTESNTSPVENFPEIVTLGDNNSNQFVGLIRLAQSISPKTGLSGQLMVRRNLSNSTRYLGTETGFYYSDEEIFDDIYGYHSTEFDLKLKQRLPWKLSFTLGSSMKNKDYENRLAMDIEGNVFSDYRTRLDNRYTYWASLEKQIRFASNLTPLKMSISITFINNQSNDLYYHYNTQYISFALEQSL